MYRFPARLLHVALELPFPFLERLAVAESLHPAVVAFLGPADELLGGRRDAVRGRDLLGRVRGRDDEHHDDVDQDARAEGEDADGEDDPEDCDIDPQVGGEPVADAGDLGALADPVELAGGAGARRGGGRAGRSARAARGLPRLWLLAAARVVLDGPHLLDHVLDLLRDHDGLVGPEHGAELVGDRLLDVRHDLVPVGIALEAAARGLQVGTERLVAVLLELVGVSVEVDRDDFVHGMRLEG